MKTQLFKKLTCLFLLFLVIAGTTQTNAQSAAIGLRFMPTFSNLEMRNIGGETVEGSATLGFGFGGFLGFYLTEYAGVQGELIYTSINQKYREMDVERKVNLQYINIPLLVSLNTGKSKMVNFNLVLGPQIGINVKSSVFSSGNDTTNAMISVKTGDLGFAYGAGLDFGVNESGSFRIGIGYRGVYGLFDISNNSQSTTTNSFYIIDRTHLKTHAAYIGISYFLN